MNLTFLGSGAAFSPTAFNAGYLLDQRLLIDCGAPAHVLIPRSGNDIAKVEAVLLTHLHGDHLFGLPSFVAARAVNHRGAPPLTIAGPPGLGPTLEQLLLLAWGERLHRIVMERVRPVFVEVRPGDDFALAGFSVHAEEVIHVPDYLCMGYVLERDGITFGFSGDCGECPGVHALIARCDTFLLEMTGVENDPSHMSRGDVMAIVRDNPTRTFYLTHLNDRTPIEGAHLATDLATVQLKGR